MSKSIFKVFDKIKADDKFRTELLNLKKKKKLRYSNMPSIIGGLASLIVIFAIAILIRFNLFKPPMENIISSNISNTTNTTNITNAINTTNAAINTTNVIANTTNSTNLNTTKDLPIIAFKYSPDGMGLGELVLKNVDEVIGGNPILNKEDEIKELPVFKNPHYFENQESFISSDPDSLRKETQKIIDAFEFGPSTSENIHESTFYLEPSIITTEGDGYSITFSDNGEMRVQFPNYVPHPESIEFDGTPEKYRELIEYYYGIYKENIKALTGLYYNGIDIESDYNYDGAINFWPRLYAKEDSLQDQLFSYSFNALTFTLDRDNGDLLSISTNLNTDLKENKVGDYPILSSDEAISEFRNGNYSSSVSLTDDELKKGVVEGIELEYYVNQMVEYFIPVYKLYVTFDGGLKNYYDDSNLPDGLRSYYVFYIPAVRGEYL